MPQTLDASQLTLPQVHQHLNLRAHFAPDLRAHLNLQPLPETDSLHNLSQLAKSYYLQGSLLEGQAKLLFVSPLLWLAGFYQPEIRIDLEEKIAEIVLDDGETTIRGRMDILIVRQRDQSPHFWLLLIETKNAALDTAVGLPQLLTYASTGLAQQDSVWGLIANGIDYQFVQLQAGDPNDYHLFPKLSLLYPAPAEQILQVLGAIAKRPGGNIAVP